MGLRRNLAVLAALAVAGAQGACRKPRRAAEPAAASASSSSGVGAGAEPGWPAHGPVAEPRPDPQARGLPGQLVLAAGPALWRLELASGRAVSLAGLAGQAGEAGGPPLSLFPTAAVAADGAALWIASRGEDAEHAEQLALQRGASLQLVGPVAQHVRHPALTPDGARAVFESSHQSFRDLYVLELATGQLARLTDNREGNFEPTLSADGKTLVFSSSRDGDSELYSLAMPAGLPSAPPPATRLTAFHRDDFAPALGPAGRLAFLSDREGADRVFAMRSDGTALLRATLEPAGAVAEAAPTWSADGELAYLRVDQGRSELRVGTPGQPAWRQLTPAARSVAAYAWSPDGAWLAVIEVPAVVGEARPRARGALWAVRRDGRQRVPVLAEVEEDAVVRWLATPAAPTRAP